MNRRVIALVVLGAIVAGGVAGGLVVALTGGGDGDSRRSPPADTSTVDATDVDPEGRELLALLGRGRTLTFHARYEGRAPERPAESLVIEVWRKGDLARQDTEASNGTTVVRSSVFQLPVGNIACQRSGEEPWRCSKLPPGAPSPDQILARVTGELEGRDVTARDDTVDGRAVRCFHVAGAGEGEQEMDVCATRDGVPVLIGAAGARLEMVQLDDEVDDATFTPPA